MKNPPVDVLVAGSGAAGIAAAVTAGRGGCTTMLLDQREGPGGTGGFSGLTTLCGLYDDRGEHLNTGFPKEFAEAIGEASPIKMGRVWVLAYRPTRFREVATQLLAEAGVKTHWSTAVTEPVSREGRIVALNGIPARAVIDCTGGAEVGRLCGLDCLATDETTQAAATVFSLCGVTRDLSTPVAAAQALLPLVRAGHPALHFQPSLEPDTITAKFSGSPEQVAAVVEFLRHNVKGFEECAVARSGPSVGRRAGRMIVGEYVLTGADILAGRKFPDAMARCAWPIEQWTGGVGRFRYLPPGTFYEIPARSLRALAVQNLFMAGKTISADPDAIGSARVMGCCLATGEAAATLAARHVKGDRNTRIE